MRSARSNLVSGQIAEPQQEIVQAVGVPRLVIGVERLQLLLHFVQRRLVEQFAEIGAAEDLFELRLIDGQGLRAAFGERRIAIVDVVGDVGEQQRRSVRRRLGRIDRGDADRAALDLLAGCLWRRSRSNTSRTHSR